MVYGIISAKDNQTSLAYFKSKKVSQLEPENLKGRGLIKVDGEVMEFQTAIEESEFDCESFMKDKNYVKYCWDQNNYINVMVYAFKITLKFNMI